MCCRTTLPRGEWLHNNINLVTPVTKNGVILLWQWRNTAHFETVFSYLRICLCMFGIWSFSQPNGRWLEGELIFKNGILSVYFLLLVGWQVGGLFVSRCAHVLESFHRTVLASVDFIHVPCVEEVVRSLEDKLSPSLLVCPVHPSSQALALGMFGHMFHAYFPFICSTSTCLFLYNCYRSSVRTRLQVYDAVQS